MRKEIKMGKISWKQVLIGAFCFLFGIGAAFGVSEVIGNNQLVKESDNITTSKENFESDEKAGQYHSPKEARQKLREWGKGVLGLSEKDSSKIADSEQFIYEDSGCSYDAITWIMQQAEILGNDTIELEKVKVIPLTEEIEIVVYDYVMPEDPNAGYWNAVAFYIADQQFRLCIDDQVGKKIQNKYKCKDCNGQGIISTGNAVACAICGGTGQQYMPDLYGMGQGGFTACSGCAGAGYIGNGSVSTCKNCQGLGFLHP